MLPNYKHTKSSRFSCIEIKSVALKPVISGFCHFDGIPLSMGKIDSKIMWHDRTGISIIIRIVDYTIENNKELEIALPSF